MFTDRIILSGFSISFVLDISFIDMTILLHEF